jgi:hypothetical protein
MDDLIWIGNTLYPRWIVLLVMGLIVLVPVALLSILADNAERHHDR